MDFGRNITMLHIFVTPGDLVGIKADTVRMTMASLLERLVNQSLVKYSHLILTNVLIAVIRYYGGTKLGTGGLIDAYKTASKLAIETSSVIEVASERPFRIDLFL
jgi:hypothetical protein